MYAHINLLFSLSCGSLRLHCVNFKLFQPAMQIKQDSCNVLNCGHCFAMLLGFFPVDFVHQQTVRTTYGVQSCSICMPTSNLRSSIIFTFLSYIYHVHQ